MKMFMHKIKLGLILLCIIQCSSTRADYPKEIEISIKQKQIKVGQPLILQLTYKFDEPQISTGKDEFLLSLSPHATAEIKRGDEVVLEKGFHFKQNDLYLQNEQGTMYSGNFVFFLDSSIKRQRLIFEEPGTYTIIVKATAEVIAPPISIMVESASESDKKLLSMFSYPLDYAFLTNNSEAHFKKRPDRIEHIKKIIEGFKSHVLARLAAAHLGLNYMKKFQDEHASFIAYSEERQNALINGTLFKDAHNYLTIGVKLPDEFPIREDVLKELIVAEFIKGNRKSCAAFLDELGAKYPKGKHGRKAAKWKQELLDFQKQKAK